MFFRKVVCTLVLLSLACGGTLAAATDKGGDAADKVDKMSVQQTAPATTSSPGELTIPQNLLQAITSGGTVAVGLAVIAAVIALAMPMFGIRYCQLLGTCDNTTNNPYGYSSNLYQNDVYGQYPQAATYPTANTYQKRSVEYVGPVLQMLKAAYDKYGQNYAATTKKIS